MNWIDVDTYLRKFISFKVSMDTGKVSQYAEKFQEYFSMFDVSKENKTEVEQFIADILTGLDMRTLLICLHPADGQFRFLREKAHNV